MIPCVYYIVVGLFEFLTKYKKLTVCVVVIYAVLFIEFMYSYVNKDYNKYKALIESYKGHLGYGDCRGLFYKVVKEK